jgi:hypothetical protein
VVVAAPASAQVVVPNSQQISCLDGSFLECSLPAREARASIYWRTESSEREKRRFPNEIKNPRIQKCFLIYAANSVRIAIYAGNFDALLRHFLHRIPECQSNRLLILQLQAEIRFLIK